MRIALHSLVAIALVAAGAATAAQARSSDPLTVSSDEGTVVLERLSIDGTGLIGRALRNLESAVLYQDADSPHRFEVELELRRNKRWLRMIDGVDRLLGTGLTRFETTIHSIRGLTVDGEEWSLDLESAGDIRISRGDAGIDSDEPEAEDEAVETAEQSEAEATEEVASEETAVSAETETETETETGTGEDDASTEESPEPTDADETGEPAEEGDLGDATEETAEAPTGEVDEATSDQAETLEASAEAVDSTEKAQSDPMAVERTPTQAQRRGARPPTRAGIKRPGPRGQGQGNVAKPGGGGQKQPARGKGKAKRPARHEAVCGDGECRDPETARTCPRDCRRLKPDR